MVLFYFKYNKFPLEVGYRELKHVKHGRLVTTSVIKHSYYIRRDREESSTKPYGVKELRSRTIEISEPLYIDNDPHFGKVIRDHQKQLIARKRAEREQRRQNRQQQVVPPRQVHIELSSSDDSSTVTEPVGLFDSTSSSSSESGRISVHDLFGSSTESERALVTETDGKSTIEPASTAYSGSEDSTVGNSTYSPTEPQELSYLTYLQAPKVESVGEPRNGIELHQLPPTNDRTPFIPRNRAEHELVGLNIGAGAKLSKRLIEEVIFAYSKNGHQLCACYDQWRNGDCIVRGYYYDDGFQE